MTDLPPQAAVAAWYGLRMWIEHGFEQFKSTGWQWQKTRISDADRAARMWLALALATFWVVAVGGQHDHDERPQETVPHLPATEVHQQGPENPGGNRLVSVFLQGDRRHHGPAHPKAFLPAPRTGIPSCGLESKSLVKSETMSRVLGAKEKNLPQ